MPIFVYGCEACEHRFEDIQVKRSDPEPSECPKCKCANVRKVPTTAISVWGPNDAGCGGWVQRKDGFLMRDRPGNGDIKYGEGHV